MKTALIITGTLGLIFAIIGSIIKTIAITNEDAPKRIVGDRIVALGSVFLIVFTVLVITLAVNLFLLA